MSILKRISHPNLRQSGLSLIELVIFIVIVSVGIAGILSVMNITTKESADPMLRKQALSIAESLMEEIQMQPFTFCDPDDASVETATSGAGCSIPEIVGGESETRFGTPRFDNVNDYHNPLGSPATSILGTPISGYTTRVSITQVGAGAIPLGNAAAALQINVRVTGPSGTDISLTGYRTQYAPNTGL
jgi:MSHA pilin protein MshD